MTFESFDAVPMVESAGFYATALPTEAPLEPAEDLATAMRQIAQAPQAEVQAASGRDVPFNRAEAELIDLWVRAGDNAYRGLERPALAASASLHGLMAAGDDLDFRAWTKTSVLRANFIMPDPGNYDDANGNGQYDEGEEIIVKGTRPKTVDEDGVPWEPKPGDDIGGGEKGGGPGVEPGEERNDCRDRQALEVKELIKDHPDDERREHGSLIYRGADGRVHHSEILHGDADSIERQTILDWMRDNGVSMGQVIGFVHNHDAWWYATNAIEAAVNRYPSTADWSAAKWFVAEGAGGSGGSGFAMYVIDTNGHLREFEFEDRAQYERLTQNQKERGTELPDETESDGSSCG